MEKRLDNIDMTKGILMLFVVAFHVVAWSMLGLIVLEVLFGAAMCVYFILSGYTFNPYKRSYTANIGLRAKSLGIPFLAYFTGIYLIDSIYMLFMGETSLINALKDFPMELANRVLIINTDYTNMNPFGLLLYDTTVAMWFLVQLFLSSIIFFAVAKVVKKSLLYSLAVILLLMTATCLLKQFCPPLVCNLQDSPGIASLMLIGCLFKEKDVFNKHKVKGVKLVVLVVFTIVISLVMFFMCGVPNTIGSGKWGNLGSVSVYTGVLLGVIQFIALAYLCEALSKIKFIRNPLVFIGQNTLDILLVHLVIGVMITRLSGFSNIKKPSGANDGKTMAMSALIFIATMALSLLWTVLLKKIKKAIKKSK